MKWGHRGATGGCHWAGGLHSCGLLLLIGTGVMARVKDACVTASARYTI